MENQKLISSLFETKAIRICPINKPFWYTSGTIGPYYINTHFLYGSEEKAKQLLNLIDTEKSNILECPLKVLDATMNNYNSDSIFKGVIDAMIDFIKTNIGLQSFEYISGGERRDWFFSPVIAEILGKPHISIYKDLKTVLTFDGSTSEIDNIEGKKVLHIADLITEASSYERAWIPAIKHINGDLNFSLVVVDRKQGGKEFLEGEGIKSFSMVEFSRNFFDNVLSNGSISEQQYKLVTDYIDNPKEAMRQFLIEHPEFLNDALNSDEKTAERAKLCLEKNFYDIKI